MAQCTNCKTQLSCGCQTRVASNGTKVCSNCLADYENRLAALKQK
jgi:hypothetical protein